MAKDIFLSECPGVRFRVITGHQDYLVGEDGSVWSRKRAKPLKMAVRAGRGGYPTACFWERGRGAFYRKVHQLVLEEFVGSRPPGMVVRHFPDRTPTNCRLDNLCWGTPSQNQLDSVFHGTNSPPLLKGEGHPNSIVTELQVREIHQRASSGERPESLAVEFNVCVGTVYAICSGATWAHLGMPKIDLPGKSHVGERNPSAKLSKSDVEKIRSMYATCKYSQVKLAEMFGVTQALISKIIRRDVWNGTTAG